jgi:hypothetical protein
MTNETNNVAAALLTLLAAFEAERVALHNRLAQIEALQASEIARIDEIDTALARKLSEVEKRVDGLHHRENLFDVHASKLMERVTDLEQTNRLRGEISGMDTDELEEIKERLDMLERAGDDVMDEEAVRELVDRMLERATVTISL